MLTVSGGSVSAYVGGSLGFTTSTTVMNIGVNPVNFFLDNTVGSGLGEYSTGNIALIRVYDGELSARDVTALDQAGLPSQGAVPEPATMGLLAGGLAGLAFFRRRRNA